MEAGCSEGRQGRLSSEMVGGIACHVEGRCFEGMPVSQMLKLGACFHLGFRNGERRAGVMLTTSSVSVSVPIGQGYNEELTPCLLD